MIPGYLVVYVKFDITAGEKLCIDRRKWTVKAADWREGV